MVDEVVGLRGEARGNFLEESVCVCVCVCVYKGESEEENSKGEKEGAAATYSSNRSSDTSVSPKSKV